MSEIFYLMKISLVVPCAEEKRLQRGRFRAGREPGSVSSRPGPRPGREHFGICLAAFLDGTRQFLKALPNLGVADFV